MANGFVDFEIYMTQIREAKEKRPEERTPDQKKLLAFLSGSPSYNSLFGKGSKTSRPKGTLVVAKAKKKKS